MIDYRTKPGAESEQAKGAESSDFERARTQLTSQAFNPPKLIHDEKTRTLLKDGRLAAVLGSFRTSEASSNPREDR
jgi:hypothetical protein